LSCLAVIRYIKGVWVCGCVGVCVCVCVYVYVHVYVCVLYCDVDARPSGMYKCARRAGAFWGTSSYKFMSDIPSLR
jgi:hypothetical protein